MKCPYCGNDDPDKFLYPDKADGPYVICRACNGEFEEGEVEYYEAQSEEEGGDELISLDAVIEALENEIEWSKGNIHLAPNEDLADWYIKGLIQARWLISQISNLDPQDDLSTLKPKEDTPTGTPGWMGDYGATPFGPVDV